MGAASRYQAFEDCYCRVAERRKPEWQIDYTRVSPPVCTMGQVDENALLRAREAASRSSVNAYPSFEVLADFIPQFVWMCTPDGLNVYFNQRWVDYTGLTLEESYGKGWNIPFHPDDKQAAWDAWNHATETGEPYQVESRLRAADGSYRWFLMRGEPLEMRPEV